jgi:hypothetical protein
MPKVLTEDEVKKPRCYRLSNKQEAEAKKISQEWFGSENGSVQAFLDHSIEYIKNIITQQGGVQE